jgi:hypothetical protein
MANMPYEARLVMLGMESLELKLDMQWPLKRKFSKLIFTNFSGGQAPGPSTGGDYPLPHLPLLRQAIPHQKILDPPLSLVKRHR